MVDEAEDEVVGEVRAEDEVMGEVRAQYEVVGEVRAEEEVVGEVRAEGVGEDEVVVEVLQVALNLEQQVSPALVVLEDVLDWILLKVYGNKLSPQPLVSITVKLLALLYHLHQM